MAHRKSSAISRGYAPFLIPGIVMFLLIVAFPFLANVGISFVRWQGVGTPVWYGLGNYQKAIHDSVFWTSFGNNLRIIITMITIPTLIGLLLAVVLFDYVAQRFGAGVASFFRAGFYVPQIIPVVVAAMVWRWILQPDWGILNWLLRAIGLGSLAHNWLGDPHTALPSVLVMMTWFQIGYPLVIFMAALQRIDPELYEAAAIDGASWPQRFFHITFHLIKPEIFVVILTTTIYSLKTFGQIFAMTRGGPGTATMVASYFSYKNFFENSNIGYGATMSTVLTGIIILLTIVWVRVQAQQELQEA
ncbi:MAG: sugar ABC transporter permease [Anaerolineae bacterium]|nr:sugar ABC transporter permease [Anaerolineae bacterium]